jgi:hypothetical protein
MSASPRPPVDMVMPAGPQLVFTVLWGSVAAVLLVWALVELVVRRRPLFLLLLLGGALCYAVEPMVDVLGLLWHPVPGQWVALDTFRAVPLWGLFVYVICFGGLPYVMYRDFRAHASVRRLLTWIGIFWLVDVAVEWPILASGLYVYYGDAPMTVGGLPLYWLVMNIEGPLSTAVLLLRVPALRRGAGMLAALLLPVTLDASGSVVTGWPVFSALHAGAAPWAAYGAAVATLALGAGALTLTIRAAVPAERAGHGVPPGRSVPV